MAGTPATAGRRRRRPTPARCRTGAPCRRCSAKTCPMARDASSDPPAVIATKLSYPLPRDIGAADPHLTPNGRHVATRKRRAVLKALPAAGRAVRQLRRLHCWLAPPLQDQRMIFVPLAVPAALASRQSPDCTPVMVPLALRFHCWLVCPLQSQMMTAVPLVVPRL